MQAQEGGEQRQRDHDGDDRRPVEAAQEQPDHRHDQHEPVQQVFVDGMQRALDQGASIIEGLDAHARGQDLLVEFAHALVDARQHAGRVLAPAHQHETLDDLRLLVPAHRPAPGRVGLPYLGHVAHGDRAAAPALQDDRADVLRGLDEAEAADGELLLAAAQEAAAHVHAGARDRLVELRKRHPHRMQPGRIGYDMHFLEEAAEGHHVRHALHLAQGPADRPLELGAQLVQVVAVAHQPELVDLAQRRGLRRQLGLHPVGQLHLGEPLRHQ